jgi:signal-transduction protein with cAMP-binding, CBS, and nucleotidyltransferase domain
MTRAKTNTKMNETLTNIEEILKNGTLTDNERKELTDAYRIIDNIAINTRYSLDMAIEIENTIARR